MKNWYFLLEELQCKSLTNEAYTSWHACTSQHLYEVFHEHFFVKAMTMSVQLQKSSIYLLISGFTVLETPSAICNVSLTLHIAEALKFPQSVRAAYTEPCTGAAPLQSHSQRVSRCSQQYLCSCLCVWGKCNLNHIFTLTVSRQHTQSQNSSRGCLEIPFPPVIFKAAPVINKPPLKTGVSV